MSLLTSWSTTITGRSNVLETGSLEPPGVNEHGNDGTVSGFCRVADLGLDVRETSRGLPLTGPNELEPLRKTGPSPPLSKAPRELRIGSRGSEIT